MKSAVSGRLANGVSCDGDNAEADSKVPENCLDREARSNPKAAFSVRNLGLAPLCAVPQQPSSQDQSAAVGLPGLSVSEASYVGSSRDYGRTETCCTRVCAERARTARNLADTSVGTFGHVAAVLGTTSAREVIRSPSRRGMRVVVLPPSIAGLNSICSRTEDATGPPTTQIVVVADPFVHKR